MEWYETILACVSIIVMIGALTTMLNAFIGESNNIMAFTSEGGLELLNHSAQAYIEDLDELDNFVFFIDSNQSLPESAKYLDNFPRDGTCDIIDWYESIVLSEIKYDPNISSELIQRYDLNNDSLCNSNDVTYLEQLFENSTESEFVNYLESTGAIWPLLDDGDIPKYEGVFWNFYNIYGDSSTVHIYIHDMNFDGILNILDSNLAKLEIDRYSDFGAITAPIYNPIPNNFYDEDNYNYYESVYESGESVSEYQDVDINDILSYGSLGQ